MGKITLLRKRRFISSLNEILKIKFLQYILNEYTFSHRCIPIEISNVNFLSSELVNIFIFEEEEMYCRILKLVCTMVLNNLKLYPLIFRFFHF